MHQIGIVISSVAIIFLQLVLWNPVTSSTSNKSIFGIRTKDSAYISTLSTVAYNGVTLLDDFQWIREIGGCLIGVQGDISDCEMCFDLIATMNMNHELNFNDRSLDCRAIAYMCRQMIASRLRTNERHRP